ncbi:MAG: FAD-dependent oxidoreductase, partial [Spirochaetaceae bacterium]|nr:FAD-dependent oxidoreductase [Spirochaetaceae bacterium]
PITCIQNPAAGKEKELGIGTLQKAENPKKVMIAGGGVAGMKVAEIAARRGHEVVLYEKDAVLGGQIHLVKHIPFRNEFSEVARYIEYEIKQMDNIRIQTSRVCDLQTIEEENPDIFIVATGAVELIPDMVKTPKAVTSWDILKNKVEIGKNILVYDPLSFNEGVGIVEHLFETYEDIKVHYITPQNDIAMNAKNENKDILLRRLLPLDLRITPHMALIEADADKLIFRKTYTDKEMSIWDSAFDNFIYTGHMKSTDDLFWKLEDEKNMEVYRLGYAKAPSSVEIIIREADLLARSI